MTALQLSDIHTGINTVEQLGAYVGEIFYYQYPGSIQLTDNSGQRINYPMAQRFQFEADDGNQYVRFEFIIPLKNDIATTPRYGWMHSKEIDAASPLQFPEAYKAANLPA